MCNICNGSFGCPCCRDNYDEEDDGFFRESYYDDVFERMRMFDPADSNH